MFDSAVVLRGRACCQTSCGVSACRTWLWSTLMMICLCTHQTPAWDGTPWTKWAQGPARCPGPKALLHGRVRPRDTHTHPHPFIGSFTLSHTSAWIHTYSIYCVKCRSEDFLYLWAGLRLVGPSGVMWFLKHCRMAGGGEEVWSWGWKHVIPVGGEARKEDSLCLITLPAGWVCGMICELTTERERHKDRRKQCANRVMWHILISVNKATMCNFKTPVWKKDGTKHWSEIIRQLELI